MSQDPTWPVGTNEVTLSLIVPKFPFAAPARSPQDISTSHRSCPAASSLRRAPRRACHRRWPPRATAGAGCLAPAERRLTFLQSCASDPSKYPAFGLGLPSSSQSACGTRALLNAFSPSCLPPSVPRSTRTASSTDSWGGSTAALRGKRGRGAGAVSCPRMCSEPLNSFLFPNTYLREKERACVRRMGEGAGRETERERESSTRRRPGRGADAGSIPGS